MKSQQKLTTKHFLTSHLSLLTCILLILAPALRAANAPAKPNTLTKEQIADGWILLFDGETPFGWKISGSSHIVDGMLILGEKNGSTETIAETTSVFGSAQLTFNYQTADAHDQLFLSSSPLDLRVTAPNQWQKLSVQLGAQEGKPAMQNGQPINFADAPRSTVGFKIPAGSQLMLRDIKLKPTNMKPIFNGKDLTGWKVFPDHKSVFTVTDKGELNIKNGNGQIQTEAEWADLILQLDVFSNGDHLNSGVFFRTVPANDIWQGYEAQIRNEWDGYSKDPAAQARKEDRTKPIDFGTGAFHNHQPTRKVVSSDREWFTYTILANGPHMATWVNGYQTADWTDDSKDAKSPRKGRYLGKGSIALQGHDPTTDLSFRNIKIQELPEKNGSGPK